MKGLKPKYLVTTKSYKRGFIVYFMFIMSYQEELPGELEEHFRANSRKQFNSENYREVKIVKNAYSINLENYYFSGIIYFKRKIKDFDYQVRELTKINIEPKSTYVGYELGFIIMKDPKIIIFFNRDETLFLGADILSEVLFNKKGVFKQISFDCTGIYNNRKKERVTDIRFNGVRSNGKITAQGQWGTDIDHDLSFLNFKDRYGIGFIWNNLRITIYQGGSVLFKTTVKNFDEQMKIRREVIKKFLKYSNYI